MLPGVEQVDEPVDGGVAGAAAAAGASGAGEAGAAAEAGAGAAADGAAGAAPAAGATDGAAAAAAGEGAGELPAAGEGAGEPPAAGAPDDEPLEDEPPDAPHLGPVGGARSAAAPSFSTDAPGSGNWVSWESGVVQSLVGMFAMNMDGKEGVSRPESSGMANSVSLR